MKWRESMEKGKIIKITPESYQIIDMDFEDKNYRTKLKELIGNNCDIVETVYPEPLKQMLNKEFCSNNLSVVMLVDEDGHRKRLPHNNVGTLLYGGPSGIVGNILLCGIKYDPDEESNVYSTLTAAELAYLDKLCQNLLQNIPDYKNFKPGYSCTACVKLNHENGGTLPLKCPKLELPCLCIKPEIMYSPNFIEIFAKEMQLRIYEDMYKEKFKIDIDEEPSIKKKLQNLKIIQDELNQKSTTEKENLTKQTRFPMFHHLYDQEQIILFLKQWDILIKKGDKTLYTLERY